MESYSQKGLVQATNKNRLYDYIAEHYCDMSKYELKEVLLSVLGVGYDRCHGIEDELRYGEQIADELASRDFGED